MAASDFRYPILICWDEDTQAFIADVPDFPNCTGSGATRRGLHWPRCWRRLSGGRSTPIASGSHSPHVRQSS